MLGKKQLIFLVEKKNRKNDEIEIEGARWKDGNGNGVVK